MRLNIIMRGRRTKDPTLIANLSITRVVITQSRSIEGSRSNTQRIIMMNGTDIRIIMNTSKTIIMITESISIHHHRNPEVVRCLRQKMFAIANNRINITHNPATSNIPRMALSHSKILRIYAVTSQRTC